MASAKTVYSQNYFMTRIPVRPKKSLGQNFLIDENIARKIVASLNLTASDYVFEIGSGTGILTKYLVQHAAKVIAVEIDNHLATQLQEKFSTATNLVLLQGDILKLRFDDILSRARRWKAVANLPYHITSPVLFKLIDQRYFFESATLMVQKEVAQRMVAKASTKVYGILSVFSQYYAETKILFDVSKHVFFPKPEVTSAVVRLDFNQPDLLDEHEAPIFRQIVRGAFNQRRKMLRNSLLAISDIEIDLNKIDFDLTQRPEQLSVSDFVELTKRIVGQLGNSSCR